MKKIIILISILVLSGVGVWYWQIQKGNTNIFCGGIAGFSCPSGYSCKLGGSYPDAGGTCIRSSGTGPIDGV